MKISKIAFLAIRGSKGFVDRLVSDFSVTKTTAYNWISSSRDKENGPLTTAKALQIISEETGLTQDEILEEAEVKVA